MINVLFIALEFPPIQVAGSFRALRFAKLLPSHGIRRRLSRRAGRFPSSRPHSMALRDERTGDLVEVEEPAGKRRHEGARDPGCRLV